MALGGDPKSPSGRQKDYHTCLPQAGITQFWSVIIIKYMAKKKKKAESTKEYKEYLAWLKASRIKAAKIQKEYKSTMKALAGEVAGRHKDYLT